MNTSVLIAWIVVLLFAIISALLLMGKGAILIAGYNIMSKDNQHKFNKVKLCRVIGSGFSILTIILGISAYYEFDLPMRVNWLIPWGYLGTIAITIIFANTMCQAKE